MDRGPRVVLCNDVAGAPAITDCQEVTPAEFPKFLDTSGKTVGREAWIEEALATRPALLLLDRLNPTVGQPVLIGRQLQVGDRGNLDLLFLEPTGVLTLVETKLAANRELRREVLAQTIDYATFLTNLSYAQFQDWLRSPEQPLSDSQEGLSAYIWRATRHANPTGAGFQDWSDKFKRQVEENLSQRQIRLLIVADSIDPRLRDLAEFLLAGGRPVFQLALLEITPYSLPDRTGLLLVPTVHWSHTPPLPTVDLSPVQWTLDRFLQDARDRHLQLDQVAAIERLCRELDHVAPLTAEFGRGRDFGQFNVRYERLQGRSFLSVDSMGRLYIASANWYGKPPKADAFRSH